MDFDNSIAKLIEGKGLVVQWKQMPVSHYRSKRRKWPKSTATNGETTIDFLKRQEEMQEDQAVE